jgi:hypothetical protein
MAGFTVSALTTYVRENADKIYTAAILGAQTLKYPGISIQAGIKNADKLMLFANTAPIQPGGVCAFNASGSSTFSDVTLTVTPLKWNDTFCPETLENKFLATKLIPGSNYDTLPFEQLIVDNVTNNLAAAAEQYTWQGDTALTANNALKQVDGWLKKIDAGSPILATATAAVTAANVISIFDDVYAKIPAQLLNHPEKKMVAFTGWDVFRLLIIALKNANAFHYDAGNAATAGEITLPGSGLKVVAVNGLNTIATSSAAYTQRIVCTYPQNLFVGTDLISEFEQADFWYSKDDQNIKGSIKWKVGYQVAYTTEVVTYKNS